VRFNFSRRSLGQAKARQLASFLDIFEFFNAIPAI
jgi:hypothetical protein